MPRLCAHALVAAALAALVNASALTTTIAANERSCYYANVDKSGEKVPRAR
jgi:uncharacterized membrane protein